MARPRSRAGASSAVDGQREGRAAELDRIEAEEEVVHDRVADHGHLDDAVRAIAASARDVADQPSTRLAHRRGQLAVAAGVHHDVGDPAHQVLAEADLRVHHAGRGQHLAGDEVGEMGGDGGRADVDGEAVDALDAGPATAPTMSRPSADRGGDLPCAGAQRLLQPGEHGEAARTSAIPHCGGSASASRRKSLDGSCMSGSATST